MTDCSKCAIQKRLKEHPDIKISDPDVMSRVIYEKINKNSMNKEELELQACGERIKEEKNVSMTTALKICSQMQKNSKHKDY